MAFADSLRGPDNSKLEGDKYWLDEAAVRTQGWIRYSCEKRRNLRMAEWYLLEIDLHEGGWSLGCFDSLYRSPVSGSQYLVGEKINAMNGAPLFAVRNGAICLPMTHSPAMAMDAGKAFAYFTEALRKLLQEDGFTGIRLEKVSCSEVYDEYTRQGGFLTAASFPSRRVTTKTLAGYTVRFHVEW